MQIDGDSFADVYRRTIDIMKIHPIDGLICRGSKISHEVTGYTASFPLYHGISIYSHVASRAIPIKFTLGEFLWIMGGYNEVDLIARYNKGMAKWSDDGKTLYGAYGPRIMSQLPLALKKLADDKYSRQACIAIYQPSDLNAITKDTPCNIFLQFLIRGNRIDLIVSSRSSDFITGYSIDSVHWQLLLMYVCNTMRVFYDELECGWITYHIASLHIYESDAQVFNMWEPVFAGFDHSIQLQYSATMTGLALRTRIFKLFKDAHLLEDLIQIMGFEQHTDAFIKLQDIFSKRKYKIQK